MDSSIIIPLTQVFYLLLSVTSGYVPPESLRDDSYLTSSHHYSHHNVSVKRDADCQNPPTATDTTQRLQDLRRVMRNANLQAYLIPTDDEHQSEYVSPYDKRREYISGFTGSQGFAVVTLDKAAIWVDGRYFLQGEQELDCNWILQKQGLPDVPSIAMWLISQLQTGQRAAIDPQLISYQTFDKMRMALQKQQRSLIGHAENLVDLIWTSRDHNRPQPPRNPAFILDLQYTGQAWRDKVRDIRQKVADSQTTNTTTYMLVVTALDEIAWLLNLRGSDIPFNPVFKSYLLLTNSKILLYIDQHKVSQEVRDHLTGPGGRCADPLDIYCTAIRSYGDVVADLSREQQVVQSVIINSRSSQAIYDAITTDKIKVTDNSVIMLTKCKKNAVEAQGMRDSHIRDAVALIDFMAMLEKEVQDGKEWDEVGAALKLDQYRSEQTGNRGPSFDTISASGENGAIIHYSPKAPDHNAKITTDKMYLLDSGGQYLDGTTDVTRTFHFGQPTDWQKECYTRVLMGSINMAKAIFPANRLQGDIDALAREPLWSAGLDYRHGTSHGIGHFLHVHEGPTTDPLYPHVFMSDEPGYYEDGQFGIRLETIVMVTPAETTGNFFNAFTFEAITLVPFEPNLIDTSLMTSAQIKWLNDYNSLIRDKVGEELKRQGKTAGYNWMMVRTEPLRQQSPPHLSGASSSSSSHNVVMATASLVVLMSSLLY